MTSPVIVGISGASGAVYGIEALKMIGELGLESHLVVSENGARTIATETPYSIDDVKSLASKVYGNKDMGAAISSGSFRTQGMIVAPCSIKSLSGIANSSSSNLLIRAADVTLKEKRPLVLMLRETPLHRGHIDLMARVADFGATIHPPLPAFYANPGSLEDIVRHSVGRALDHLGVTHDLIERWPNE